MAHSFAPSHVYRGQAKYHNAETEPVEDGIAAQRTASLTLNKDSPSGRHGESESADLNEQVTSPEHEESRSRTVDLMAKNMRRSRPSLLLSKAIETNKGLRRRHLGVLTSILHISLLRADYERASRAWALLLRSEMNGRSTDLRFNNRWGIGAELLWQQGVTDPQVDSLRESSLVTSDTSAIARVDLQQLNKVLSYFDRLRLEYPPSRTQQNTVNAIGLYYAQLCSWIYAIASFRSQDVEDNGDSDSSSGMDNTSAKVLAAQRIANHIKDTLDVGYYSDFEPLMRLQEMVQLWIKDLTDQSRKERDS